MYITIRKQIESVVYVEPELLYQMFVEMPGYDVVVYTLYAAQCTKYPDNKTGVFKMFSKKKVLYVLKVIKVSRKPSFWKRLLEWVKAIIRG